MMRLWTGAWSMTRQKTNTRDEDTLLSLHHEERDPYCYFLLIPCGFLRYAQSRGLGVSIFMHPDKARPRMRQYPTSTATPVIHPRCSLRPSIARRYSLARPISQIGQDIILSNGPCALHCPHSALSKRETKRPCLMCCQQQYTIKKLITFF